VEHLESRRSPRVLDFHPEVDAVATQRFALRFEHMFQVDQHAAIGYDIVVSWLSSRRHC